MIAMKRPFTLVSVLFVILMLVLVVAPSAGPATSSSDLINVSGNPTASTASLIASQERFIITSGPPHRVPSGEVEYPITGPITPIPTIQRPTVQYTPTFRTPTVTYTPVFQPTTVITTSSPQPTTAVTTPATQPTTVLTTPTIQPTTVITTPSPQPTTVATTPTTQPTTVPDYPDNPANDGNRHPDGSADNCNDRSNANHDRYRPAHHGFRYASVPDTDRNLYPDIPDHQSYGNTDIPANNNGDRNPDDCNTGYYGDTILP